VQPAYSQPLQYTHLLGRRDVVCGCQQARSKSTRRSWAKNPDHSLAGTFGPNNLHHQLPTKATGDRDLGYGGVRLSLEATARQR
jgi:hypothetical protein